MGHCERIIKCFNRRTKGLMSHIQTTSTTPATSEVVVGPQEKKKPSEQPTTKNIVVLSKNYRQEVSAATSKFNTVSLLVAGAAEMGQRVRESKVLIDPLKSWAYCARKVAECVAKCHGSDVGKFLDETL